MIWFFFVCVVQEKTTKLNPREQFHFQATFWNSTPPVFLFFSGSNGANKPRRAYGIPKWHLGSPNSSQIPKCPIFVLVWKGDFLPETSLISRSGTGFLKHCAREQTSLTLPCSYPRGLPAPQYIGGETHFVERVLFVHNQTLYLKYAKLFIGSALFWSGDCFQ